MTGTLWHQGEDRSVLTRAAPAPDLSLRYGSVAEHVVDGWLGDTRAAGRPLVILIHGGFWRPEYDRTHTRPMAAALREAGWSVASIEYRREPGKPDLAVDDVRVALATVPDVLAAASGPGHPHDGSVVVIGHSAGGHLALWAAAVAPAHGLRATIALAPVADLRLAHQLQLDGDAVTEFLGRSAADRVDLDPARLAGPRTPAAIVHGTEDAVVPIGVAESYSAAHPATRLAPVTGAGHYALIDPRSAAWPVVTAELARLGG